jgi:hypothetical protein
MTTNEPPTEAPLAPRRPGRPTKAEAAARKAALARGALSTAVATEIQALGTEKAGLRIWQWLSQSEFARWPSLCAELDNEQKIALCLHLLCKGHAALTVANKLGFMPHFVKDIWRDYTAKVGDDVMGITLPSLVGRIDAYADALRDMAIDLEKPERAWKIEKERIELLQDLGVVERAAKRYEVAHQHTLKAEGSADAEVQAEVNRILEIERKRRESSERVKRIDARVMDSLPQGTQAPDEDL